MRVWRVTRRAHAAPDGEGARLYGGRWNLPNTPVVYASASLSLAVLEYLVHVDRDLAPSDLVSIAATIPISLPVETIEIGQLPNGWQAPSDQESLQRLGSEWVQVQASAVLRVPSALIPVEFNYLLNPAHSDFGRIVWADPVPFSLDPRFLQ
mgnify:FL=1